MKSPYMDAMEKSLQSMNDAMAAVLQANTSVFESFQASFRKVVEQNSNALAKTAASISPGLAEQIKEQAEEIKAAMLKDLANMK